VVEGKLSLTTNSCLTVGPNGHVKADVSAREVIVRARLRKSHWPRQGSALEHRTGIREVQTDRWHRGRRAGCAEESKPVSSQTKPQKFKASAATATGKAVDTAPLNSERRLIENELPP